MKKILSTILVAVAFAAVGTVDAKRMAQPKSMSQSASNIADVSRAALKGQATQQDVIDTLKNEPQTGAEQDTIALTAKIADLKNKRDAIKTQLSEQKWFGFFRNTAEEKQAINDLNARLNTINGDLMTAEKDLSLARKEVSRSWYQISLSVVKTAIAIGIPLAIIADLYYDKGYTKGMMTEVREGLPRTRKYIGDTGAAIQQKYRTMRGTNLEK